MHGSECFQGALDEVRLYREALAPAEIAALYRLGQPALERFARELERSLERFLVPGESFAATLARTRQRLAEAGVALDREVGAALMGRLKARHPLEFTEFFRATGLKPLDLLDTAEAGGLAREGERLFELLVEYRPLTEAQWQRQTAADRQHWAEIEVLERRFATLRQNGEATQFSPAWIELLLEVGQRVQLRPFAQEAVAPYVRPRTPETRALTAGEARAALEHDWLHQADQAPTPERIRREIHWTRELAARLEAGAHPPLDLAGERDELTALEGEVDALAEPDRALYFRVREVKRRVAFKNPVVDFDQVLFVDMPFPQGSEWQHETRHRLGYMAVPGGRLLVLEGLDPGGQLRQLLPQAPLHGSFWRPDLSWDARRVLVCFKPHNEKSFHLYEINVDGTGWRQLTDGPYDDLDPIYLPDERHVVFTTTRGLTKVTADVPWPECGNGPVDPVESPRYHRSGTYPAYYSPYPLGEQDFLVSAQRDGKFRLYLMDVDGNRELVYEGVHHVFHALPLKPRPRPPVLVDTVSWPVAGCADPPEPGVLYSRDVYQGAPTGLRGQARFLRVLSIDHKTYTYWHQRPYLSTGPVVSGVQSDGVKRLLGTVPIEPDGSVAFTAPSGIPLHFQLLDAEQRALHTMRSFANLMPGESRGCLGCHERHTQAPAAYGHPLAALRPRAITPPPWDDATVSYPRYVRPVLDRYCAPCHTGEGKGRPTLDLTARPGFLGFDETYWTFIGWPTWGQPYRTPEPMTRLSYRSRLIALASSGTHHDVRVEPLDLLRLKVWVDTICPYRGEEEIRALPDPEFQGVDWLAVRPRIQTAPHIARPGPLN